MSLLSLPLSLYVECLINISYLLVADCVSRSVRVFVRVCVCVCVWVFLIFLPLSRGFMTRRHRISAHQQDFLKLSFTKNISASIQFLLILIWILQINFDILFRLFFFFCEDVDKKIAKTVLSLETKLKAFYFNFLWSGKFHFKILFWRGLNLNDDSVQAIDLGWSYLCISFLK